MNVLLNPRTLGLIAATYIVQFVYVVVGRSAINNIVVAGYEVIFHPAVQNRRELLFRHPLITATFSGLVLGVLPLRAIASGLGFISKLNANWSWSWQNTKLWIAIPFALVFLLAVSSYVAGAAANVLPAWQGFFVAPCALDSAHLLVYRNGCANQLLFTAPLTCALVYSLTALFDRWRNRAGRESLLVASGTTGEIV
jgi:hypothetical protein